MGSGFLGIHSARFSLKGCIPSAMKTAFGAHERRRVYRKRGSSPRPIPDAGFPAQTLVTECETSGRFRGQIA